MEEEMKSAGGDDVDMIDADIDPLDTSWGNVYPEDDVICMNGGSISENEESQKENRENPNKSPTSMNSESSLPDLAGTEQFPSTLVAAERKRMGNEYFVKGEYHQAYKMYTAAIEILPEAAFFGNRAACLIMLHKYKDAVQDARRAISLDCNLKNGHIRLVRSTLALGDVISCEAAIIAANNNPALIIDLKDETQKLTTLIQLKKDIDGSISKKDFRKTLFLTERAKEIAGGDVMLKIKKAEVLIKLGRFVEAQEQCTDILQSEGMIMEAITLRAYCFYQADNLDKSLQYYKQALQLAPDNTSAAANYKRIKQLKESRESGANKFKSQNWKEALDAYKLCLELIKSDEQGNQTLESKINFNLSLVASKNDAELSTNYVNKAIDLNPNYVKAILHRASLYMTSEKFDEAIKDFEAVEKIDPHTKDIRRLIENAKVMSKRAKRKDYYKILGIDKKASNEEIKKAYKKRALVHHPDRHANATEMERRDQEKKFKEVLEAYEILLDDKKRRRYDLGLDVNESYSPNYEPFDPSQLFGHMFFQQSGMGGMGSRPGGFHQFRTGPGFSGFRR